MAAALAVGGLLGGCTAAQTEGDLTGAFGLAFVLPEGFELETVRVPEGDDVDLEALWLGPEGAVGTRVGITVVALCGANAPRWREVREAVELGEHTGLATYEPTAAVQQVQVGGAIEAVRTTGTYQLPVERTGADVPLVRDELVVLTAPQVIHRFRVEGWDSQVVPLDTDALFASVRVTATDCPADTVV